MLLAVDWLQHAAHSADARRCRTVLVLIFGAATLLAAQQASSSSGSPRCSSGSPSLAFLGSFWIGERTLTERLLGAALEGKLRVVGGELAQLNCWWVVFYAPSSGALNLVVAVLASERVWVNFKLVGLAILIVRLRGRAGALADQRGTTRRTRSP